jgi:hypothetical protein
MTPKTNCVNEFVFSNFATKSYKNKHISFICLSSSPNRRTEKRAKRILFKFGVDKLIKSCENLNVFSKFHTQKKYTLNVHEFLVSFRQ